MASRGLRACVAIRSPELSDRLRVLPLEERQLLGLERLMPAQSHEAQAVEQGGSNFVCLSYLRSACHAKSTCRFPKSVQRE